MHESTATEGGRAVVLGGGGLTGMAWEVGLLAGLRESGCDLSRADLVVGTSAGSVAGAHLVWGEPLDLLLAELEQADSEQTRLLARLGPPYLRRLAPVIRARGLGWVGKAWMLNRYARALLQYSLQRRARHPSAGPAALPAAGGVASPRVAALSRIAAEFGTTPEALSLRFFRTIVPGDGAWPAKRLLLTSIDLETGELVTWDSTSGVPLPVAVAASCALPGFVPPITIGGRRYIDGGMYSATNLPVARGSRSALVVAPIFGRPEARELAAVRASGVDVRLVLPDPASLRAIGTGLWRLDVVRRRWAAAAGREQGARIAGELAPDWGSVASAA